MNTTNVETAPVVAPRFDGRLLFESTNLDIVHLTLKTGDAIAPHSNPVDVVFFCGRRRRNSYHRGGNISI